MLRPPRVVTYHGYHNRLKSLNSFRASLLASVDLGPTGGLPTSAVFTGTTASAAQIIETVELDTRQAKGLKTVGLIGFDDVTDVKFTEHFGAAGEPTSVEFDNLVLGKAAPPPPSPKPQPLTSPVVLDDAAMVAAGEVSLLSTDTNVFASSTFSDYGPIYLDGVILTNLDRNDFAFTSSDSNFDAVNGYFYDGSSVLSVPAGSSGASSRIEIERSDGSSFGIRSIALDTIFAASDGGISVDFAGRTPLGKTVTETFQLDNVQGFQTFSFDADFDELKSIQFAASIGDINFDAITLLPPVPATPSAMALSSPSDSGKKGDNITNATRPVITGTGEAGDTVTLEDGVTQIGTIVAAPNGSWSITPSAALASGAHALTAVETDGAGNVSAVSAPLTVTIKTSAMAPFGLSFTVAADEGTAGDAMEVTGTGEVGDAVTLFDGASRIGSTKVTTGGVWSITTEDPLAVGTHSLSASEVDVAENKSAASPALTLTLLSGAPNRAVFVGTSGKDTFAGGAGNDVFRFPVADLANGDVVKGGAGIDQLRMTTAGTVRASGVIGIETYVLANGPKNVLKLANANFAGALNGVITVDGGSAGNTLGEAGVSALDRAVLRGGAGADTLIAGRNARLVGGGGRDVFELTVPGSPTTPDNNRISDFAHGTDKIAFRKGRFGLGSNPSAATLFKANSTGSFTTAAQRFAYDTTNGKLFYDVHGNAAGSSHLLIATLAHAPTFSAADITFVA